MKKRFLCVLALLLITELLAVPALQCGAEETEAKTLTAQFEWTGFTNTGRGNDGNHSTYTKGTSSSALTLTADGNIGFLYIEFNHAPGEWVLSSGEKVSSCGENGFIHEYVPVDSVFGDTKTVTLSFPEGAEITDVYVYGKGTVPDTVQIWEPECEQADILLLSAHSDDDQLYFAGVVPYYAQVRGVSVQVIFFTEHYSENYRWHERLDSLWTAGLRNYPVVSEFPDAYSTTLDAAWKNFKNSGYSEETIVSWLATQLRRFRPLVAVTHSYLGESGGVYSNGAGHGQHMAAADGLTKAAELAADSSAVLGGLEAYDLPKLYIHCYTENKIVLDCIDTAATELGGLTPFNVSQNAFICHKSQWEDWSAIRKWIWGTTSTNPNSETITVTSSSQIKVNSPRYYGLARLGAGVPADVEKNDFLENLTPYAERKEETTDTQAPEVTSSPEETTEAPAEVTSGAETTTVPEPTSDPVVTTDPVETSDVTTAGELTTQSEKTSSSVTELGYVKTSHKPVLIAVAVICGLGLCAVLFFGIKFILSCDRH